MRRLSILPVLALVLAGCASMVAPQTPAQRLAYVDAGFTAAVEQATAMRANGVLSHEQAMEIDPVIQRGSQALDMAWTALGEGKPDTALDYLRIVNTALLELREQLRAAQDG